MRSFSSGRVHLFVSGAATDAADLARALPAGASRDYGKPLAEIFCAAKGDFYAIDPMLFSPAVVTITAIETGETFHAGRLAPRLARSQLRVIRLALIVNSPDWQSAALLDACREHGADPVPVRLADCVFDTAAPFGLRLPEFEGLPDAVLVRAVGGGTFEEVTRRLGVLHALSALNVPCGMTQPPLSAAWTRA